MHPNTKCHAFSPHFDDGHPEAEGSYLTWVMWKKAATNLTLVCQAWGTGFLSTSLWLRFCSLPCGEDGDARAARFFCVMVLSLPSTVCHHFPDVSCPQFRSHSLTPTPPRSNALRESLRSKESECPNWPSSSVWLLVSCCPGSGD